MLPLRQITGWLALVIASAGPLPLWIHHALCHTESCPSHVEHTGHSHLGAQSHAGHSHASRCDQEPRQPTTTTPDESCSDSAGQKPIGLNGTATEHDCFICHQLSQAASSVMDSSVECSSLPPIASSGTKSESSIATLCGWHSPRGPPTV